ncbi:Hsp70 family protein [Halobacteriovorax sp. GB3]|uniref:Hsp70 family protein n=1 Tax=Halobacteriovorax sp. GB3 TaxID=2719615 RepID=UPI00235FBDE4|nr:Hsp70 family protein [Halobacteriovorax sp. GB3]MDD0854273.1 Hsp70 family protein [Halobacteriovorax sp. GB3]
MAKFIGIDLGTTFSAAATVDVEGRPVIVRDSEGNNIIPSCVVVDGDTIEVGAHALDTWESSPEKGASRFKRIMGTTNKTINLSGKEFTPTELSSFVLKKIVKEVESQIGEIEEAVVTIPANFAHEAREATMLAAKKAGLKIKNIINEPTAAALYYAYKTGEDLDGIYAVFDLGGGTFDVSIIQAHGKNVEVLSSDGVSRLGGDDFDKAVIDLLCEKYKAISGNDLDPKEISLVQAEKAKKHLTIKETTKQKINGISVEVSRNDFQEKIKSLLAQIELLCESALDEAKIQTSQLKGIFLAGGSTRVPAIKEVVTKVFGKEPTSTANVDEVVALGAAIYATYRADRTKLSPGQKESVEKIKISETTNKCFGTITLTRDAARDDIVLKNTTLIPKGHKIPCSVTQSFYTTHEGQTGVNCKVTESSTIETDPKFVKIIWEGNLELPPNRPEGQKIDVTFSYDENQIMQCSFVDVATGKKTSVDLTMVSTENFDDNKIDKFLVE